MVWSRWRAFEAVAIHEAPDQPGVYAFLQKGVVVYYGISDGEGGVRATLEKHWAAERNPCLMLARERELSVAWYVTDQPVQLARALLDRFKAQRSRLPRCNQCEEADSTVSRSTSVSSKSENGLDT